jgi:PAS domain S-box-containing protein
MSGLCVDITTTKQAEEDIKKSREDFQGYFEMGSLGMCVTSVEKGWLAVNERLCQMFGYTKAELSGFAWAELTHPDDLGADLQLFEEVRAGKRERYELDKRFIRKDGSVVYTTLSVACQRKTDGTVNHFLASLLDITARKQAEETLQENEARFRAMFEGHDAMKLIIDPVTGQILDANSAAADFYGWSVAELRRMQIQQINTLPPAAVQDSIEQVVRKSQTRFEFSHRRADGSLRNVEVFSNKIVTRGKAVLYSIVQDITARKQAEETLQSALREKVALLNEVHHRVKNNLQVITSLLRLEAGRNEHPAAQSVLQEMGARVMAMALLHESLYRSGVFGVVDLGAYLRELTNGAFRAQVLRPGSIRLHQELESILVGFDQAMPCGLLVNELLCNSLKHGFPDGGNGEVRIELQLVDGGPQVRLRMSNTGVGLPADFESKRGHSLGLQLVASLVRQLEGRLTVGPAPAVVFDVIFTPKPAPPKFSSPSP